VGRGRKYIYKPIEISGNKVLGRECVCQEALSEEMTCQLRPKCEEGASLGEMGEDSPGRKNCECKGPEAGMSWLIRRGRRVWLSRIGVGGNR